jgi:hypothetical protein
MARIPVGRVTHIERHDDEHERRGGMVPLGRAGVEYTAS